MLIHDFFGQVSLRPGREISFQRELMMIKGTIYRVRFLSLLTEITVNIVRRANNCVKILLINGNW